MTGSTITPETDRFQISYWKYTFREFTQYIPSGDTIPEETWRGRHRNILFLLVAHVPFLLALGLYEGTESTITGATIPEIPLTTVLIEVGIVIGLGLLASWSLFGRRLRTAIATTGLMTISAFLVHFSGGYIEAHFHFFVMIAVVATYEDWAPFLLGVVYVALQHSFFGMMEGARVYNHAAGLSNPKTWSLIHTFFFAGLAIALVVNWYSTERSREKATAQLKQAKAKTEQVENLEAKKAEIEQTKAEVEARQQEVEQLNEHLETTADAYSKAMARAAEGELTVRLDANSESEAMAQVAQSFNEMIAETESTVQEIQAFAQEVATATEEATAGAEETSQSSEEMTQSIQAIASGTTKQRQKLDTVANEMSNLAATVEEVAASAETVAGTSHETATIAETGETTAQQAIADSREVQAAIDSTVDNVDQLDDQMTEIGEIIGLISNIAEQTNMLALNANIEAARAGSGGGTETGDGFAVVANEVKELAEETQTSATQIEQLVEETQVQTETTVEEARIARESMQEGVEAVQEVVNAFIKVADNAKHTDNGIQEISNTTDDQAASTEEAVSMVEDVAEISKTTDSESKSASTNTEEQAASISQVSANVISLSDQAEQLQSLLGKFEVSNQIHSV